MTMNNIPIDKTPKFLLDVENKLRENCRDWLVVAVNDGKPYFLISSPFAGYGMASLVGDYIRDDFLSLEDDGEDDEGS